MSIKTPATIKADAATAMPTGVTGATSVADVLAVVGDIADSLAHVVDVRWYGATGNGVTNDSAAIQSALNALVAGDTLVFPRGTYLMFTPVTVLVDNVTVIGYGATLSSNATGQDRKFTVSGRTGIKFIGLRFNGGEYTVLSTSGVEFNTYSPRTNPGTLHFVDATNSSVQACEFTGLNWPVTLLGASNNIVIEGNTFARYFAAVYGYFDSATSLDDAPTKIRITNNDFKPSLHPTFTLSAEGEARNYTFGDSNCSGAIKLRGSGDEMLDTGSGWNRSSGWVVSGNTIESSGQMGIELQSATDCTVSGNFITSCAFGISLSYNKRTAVHRPPVLITSVNDISNK